MSGSPQTQAALHTLEHRQHHARSLSQVYDLALEAARRQFPSSSAALAEVDAERLSVHTEPFDDSPSSGGRGGRMQVAPFTLDAGDVDAIERSTDPEAPDPLERLLRRRLGLVWPAIGRIRMDDAVIALLIVNHRASRAPTAADRLLVRQMADLTATAVARLRGALFADLDRGRERPPISCAVYRLSA